MARAEREQHVSGTITVAAPTASVFAILADARQHSRIDGSGSVGATVEAPPTLERGAEFSIKMRMFGLPYRVTNRVVEFEPDRLIAWRHFAGHRWRYELRPLDQATTEVTETFDYSSYSRLAAGLIRAMRIPERNQRGITETLPRLKAAAEADI